MKPFNLERALAGDPVVTRSGKKVDQLTHYHFSNPDNHKELRGVTALSLSSDYVFSWYNDGKFEKEEGSELDLFMYTKKPEVIDAKKDDSPIVMVSKSLLISVLIATNITLIVLIACECIAL